MTRYKVKISVELVECNEAVSDTPIEQRDGSFSMVISEKDAVSIDKCEQSVLKTAYPTIRSALSGHLEEISKKKACEMSEAGGQVVQNSRPYKVDGEVGRFTFLTHSILNDSDIQYDTSRDIFLYLHGKEYYRTTGFKEIALIYGDTEKSYRKTAQLINRIRYQERDGTPSRTLHEVTEREGTALLEHITEKSGQILSDHGFEGTGIYRGDDSKYTPLFPVFLPQSEVDGVLSACAESCSSSVGYIENPIGYEDPRETVNIAVDDVNVKRQEESRIPGQKRNEHKRKYAHNTIAHLSYSGTKYVLNSASTVSLVPVIMSFLLTNGLFRKRFQFFTDGHTVLNKTIIKFFSWKKNIGIILDWYHISKKCGELLSQAMKGRDLRNEVLNKLKPLLWYGLTDKAIEFLLEIPKKDIKSAQSLEKLIAYLERNRPYIPCYAARKELGLCNSSAVGEKANDLIVSERQKHNGMSWTKKGTTALAAITALKQNNGHKKWFEHKDIDFKMAA
jgi:hypothetical protein